MAAIEDFLADAKRRMDRSIESTHQEFNSIRTGRASPALLDRVTIDYYGTPTPLKSLASIGAPEARLLTVQPFDPGSMKAIERAIQESDLGLTPSNDGKVIRLPIPTLTEERRKELVKVVRRVAEDGKVAIRNVRRDVLQHLRDLVVNGEVGDDEERRAEQQVQKVTDEHTKSIDDLLKVKRRSWRSDRARDRTSGSTMDEASGHDPGVARSVAIIMDGNGRWAAARSLPVAEGHREGARAPAHGRGRGRPRDRVARRVRVLHRELGAPAEEVAAIMELLDETIDRELPDLAKQGVRTRFFGRRDRVPTLLQEKMAGLEAETAANDRLQLWIAFDYGGRAELVEAARRLSRTGSPPRTCPRTPSPSGCSRPSSPRPRHPHLGGAAALELPALAVGVRRARVRGHALARLRRGALRAALEEYAQRGRRFGAR